MDQKVEFKIFAAAKKFDPEVPQTITTKSRKSENNKREYYSTKNHYCLHEGCYWRKKLPAES